MLIATLLTIAKIWKQPKCSSTEKWIKKMDYGIYSAMGKRKSCHLQQHYAKWDESDRERQILYNITYITESKKK